MGVDAADPAEAVPEALVALEQAIRHFEDGLAVATREDMPREWATLQPHVPCPAGSGRPRSGRIRSGRRVVTIAQLVELNLPDGELAVLPGCGTAGGPARLLDEAVHVAAALQVAGYRHVVATLWSIPDAVGPRFAAAFHEALATATGPDRVHAAVCAAVAAVQERHGGHTDSWAPFVHFGP